MTQEQRIVRLEILPAPGDANKRCYEYIVGKNGVHTISLQVDVVYIISSDSTIVFPLHQVRVFVMSK